MFSPKRQRGFSWLLIVFFFNCCLFKDEHILAKIIWCSKSTFRAPYYVLNFTTFYIFRRHATSTFQVIQPNHTTERRNRTAFIFSVFNLQRNLRLFWWESYNQHSSAVCRRLSLFFKEHKRQRLFTVISALLGEFVLGPVQLAVLHLSWSEQDSLANQNKVWLPQLAGAQGKHFKHRLNIEEVLFF